MLHLNKAISHQSFYNSHFEECSNSIYHMYQIFLHHIDKILINQRIYPHKCRLKGIGKLIQGNIDLKPED